MPSAPRSRAIAIVSARFAKRSGVSASGVSRRAGGRRAARALAAPPPSPRSRPSTRRRGSGGRDAPRARRRPSRPSCGRGRRAAAQPPPAAPHPLVEREGVQEDDGHSAATSSRSAATDGRSAGALDPIGERRPRLERDPEQVARAQEPGQERDVGEPERAPAQPGDAARAARRGSRAPPRSAPARPPRRAGARSTASRSRRSGRRAAAPAARSPGSSGQQRRLGIALVQVLGDHGRLGQDPTVLLEHRHLAGRVHLVQPGGPVAQVDLDRLVRDPLLGEDDPGAGAVRAAARRRRA